MKFKVGIQEVELTCNGLYEAENNDKDAYSLLNDICLAYDFAGQYLKSKGSDTLAKDFTEKANKLFYILCDAGAFD